MVGFTGFIHFLSVHFVTKTLNNLIFQRFSIYRIICSTVHKCVYRNSILYDRYIICTIIYHYLPHYNTI